MTEIPYVRQPMTFPARYAHGPDSFVQPGVPRGVLHEYEWNESRVFPDTNAGTGSTCRRGTTSAEPASLMVFQDASGTSTSISRFAPRSCFDNLIHKGEMPVTIGRVRRAERESQRRVRRVRSTRTRRSCSRRSSRPFAPSARSRTIPTAGPSAAAAAAATAPSPLPGSGRTVPAGAQLARQLRADPRRQPATRPRSANEPPKPLRIFMQAATHDINWNAPEQELAEGEPAASRRRSPSAATTSVSSSATAATTGITAACSCPTRCAGSGEPSRRRDALRDRGVDERERDVDHRVEVRDRDVLVGRVDLGHAVREVHALEAALVEDVRVGGAARQAVARLEAAARQRLGGERAPRCRRA